MASDWNGDGGIDWDTVTDNTYGLWLPLSSDKSEIRLLMLEPSRDPAAMLRGTLQVKSLRFALHFEAVSYAWGGAQASMPLFLNTSDFTVDLPIIEHIGDALRHLRHPTETRSLWVDSICVSQQDRREREQQIGILHEVFHRAAHVHIWLGKRLAMPHEGSGTDKLRRLCKAKYWSRVWVMGETILARDMLLHYDGTAATVSVLKQLRESLPSEVLLPELDGLFDLRTFLPASMHLSTEEKARAILAVLSLARSRQVGDPRDRVHAFLGLYNSLFEDQVEADYTVDTAEVYTRFAAQLIRTSGSLRILSQANYYHSTVSGLPSWVPDWSSMYNHHPQLRDLDWWDAFSSSAWAADLEKIFSLRELRDGDRLQATAHEQRNRLPAILGSGAVVYPFSIEHTTKAVHEWWSFYRTAASSPDFAKFICAVLRGAVTAAPERERKSGLPSLRGPERYVECSARRIASKFNFATTADFERDRLAAFLQRNYPGYEESLCDRRFFITPDGEPGLGPRHMRDGDDIIVLAGVKVPVVLRQVPVYDSRNPDGCSALYSFVGCCYLYGAMNGELADSRLQHLWLI